MRVGTGCGGEERARSTFTADARLPASFLKEAPPVFWQSKTKNKSQLPETAPVYIWTHLFKSAPKKHKHAEVAHEKHWHLHF